ncbi:MAG: CPBP family intramembrane metalloprotease [Spirochaetales bacterium]|nr:CPBP family intramembrane metalloprotease [Spirochaetales bacterium]
MEHTQPENKQPSQEKSSPTPLKRKPYRILHALLDSLSVMGVMVALSVILTLATLSYDSTFVQRIEITGLLNLASFSLIIAIRWKYWKPDLKKLFTLPARSGSIILLLVMAAAGLTAVLSEIDNMLRPFLGDSLLYEILEKMFSRNLLAVFFAVGIIAPISEEFFFRGYLISRLEETVSPLTAIIAVSFLFGLFHLNPSQMVSGFFTGLILGYLFVATRSLVYPVLFHFFYNSIPVACLAAGVNIPGYTQSEAGMHQPVWFTLTGFIIMAAAVVILLQLLPSLPAAGSKHTEGPGPDEQADA